MYSLFFYNSYYVCQVSKSKKIFINFLIKAFLLHDRRKYLYNRVWLSLFFVMFCRTTEVSKISKSILLNKDFLFKKNYNK